MDAIIDENAEKHALEEQKENSLKYRNIGLGVFGYADALMALGVTYGSKDALKMSEDIFYNLFVNAVRASNNLAEQFGRFDGYDEKIFDSKIIKSHFTDEEIERLKTYGLRNCSLISVAPTGTLSTMLERSGGVEPVFALSHKRKTVSLHKDTEVYYDVYCRTVKDYFETRKHVVNDDESLPKYFVTSQDIFYKNRVDAQSVLQRHVDTAISSTVNLPNSATINDIKELYLYAWEKKLKGITVYRAGCKREGILTTETISSTTQAETPQNGTLERGTILSVSDDLLSAKRTIQSGCGRFYIHVDHDQDTGEMLETFINVGSGGGCERNLQFISRLISIALRSGVPVEDIIDQALSIRPCTAYVKQQCTSKGTSCPSAIGFALRELQEKLHSRIFEDESDYEEVGNAIKDNKPIVTNNEELSKCPECGEYGVKHEGGCDSCVECGYSYCG